MSVCNKCRAAHRAEFLPPQACSSCGGTGFTSQVAQAGEITTNGADTSRPFHARQDERITAAIP